MERSRLPGAARAIAGMSALVFALTSSRANAFTGTLVECTPTLESPVDVTLQPGLTCTAGRNRIHVEASMDRCVANTQPPWDTWAANTIGSRISAANAARIARAIITFKGVRYGSCHGDEPDWYPGTGSGMITFVDASGGRIAGGSAHFSAVVHGDLPTRSIRAIGMITNGFGRGATIEAQLAVAVSEPDNDTFISCGLRAICLPDIFALPLASPISLLRLESDATSFLRIAIPDNENCTGAGIPLQCCTGTRTGTCYP